MPWRGLWRTQRRTLCPERRRCPVRKVIGADLGATFRDLGLIDEYRIYAHPVLISRGRLLFQPTDATAALRLVETRAFGNGVVLLRYEV
jgi:riboflavin biosynthesis pyrimidine reductase